MTVQQAQGKIAEILEKTEQDNLIYINGILVEGREIFLIGEDNKKICPKVKVREQKPYRTWIL